MSSMAMLDRLSHEFANSCAGYVTSDNEALEFLQGLSEHNTTYSLQYDLLKDGFVVTKTLEFPNFISAARKARELRNVVVGRPIISERA
jgi:hypothetical protein